MMNAFFRVAKSGRLEVVSMSGGAWRSSHGV